MSSATARVWFLLALLPALCRAPLQAQGLGQLQFEEQASAGIIVDDPEAAVLVVETTVTPLGFSGRAEILRVTEPEAGVYRVFLRPGVHHVEVRAEGYLPLRLPRWSFEPKTGRRIRVTALQVAAGEGTLIVVTEPAGAAIALNEVPIAARTPATLPNQKTGQYRLTLSGVPGRGTVDTTALVQAGQTTRLLVTLPREVAGLRVDSDPAGALVVMDGDTLGRTPLWRGDLAPGERTVAVLLEGHEPNVQPVRLAAGDTATISAYLVRVTGRLTVTAVPAGVAVYVGQEKLGDYKETPLARETLAPGRYAVRGELEGHEAAVETVSVAGGRTTAVELRLRPKAGSLYVVSTPVSGAIHLDGQPQGGQTPARLEGLAPGEHRVTVKAKGFADGTATVTVGPGRTETVTVTLREEVAQAPGLFPAEGGPVMARTRRVRTPAGTEHTQVQVVSGEFQMGSVRGESDEQPVHPVHLDGYWIDQHEVTNGQYQGFVRETGRVQPRFASDGRYNEAGHPVVGVSWFDARDYCSWAGRRLPTEAEWEKAARGVDGRTYPWGEGIDAGRANHGGRVGRPTSVGSYPQGVSPYGAHDLAGNVWEWVADWYGSYPSGWVSNPTGPSSGSARVLRGGSWSAAARNLRSADRDGFDPLISLGNVGFRCAQDE